MSDRTARIARTLTTTLSALALTTAIAPAGARSAEASTPKPAVSFCNTTALEYDAFWISPDDAGSGGTYIYNSTGHVGYINVVLDKVTGCVWAWISGYNHGNIQGSVVKLQHSGYIDFRTIAHSWPNTVQPGQWNAYAGGFFYNQYGENYWWRGCGYIGSGSACTHTWKFVKSGGTFTAVDGGKH